MTQPSRRTAAVAGLLAAVLTVLTGCAASPDAASDGGGSGLGGGFFGGAKTSQPFDVRPLVKPEKKYFGVARGDAPTSMAPVDEYTEMVGKHPNLIEYYAAWGHGFNAAGVRNAWKAGTLTVVSWEPFDTPLRDIAAGGSDAYVREYARAVRKLNLPVVISFADEMNGHWEKWGTKTTTPEEYVAAWRRVRDLFHEVGAANVIWAWSPNIINPVRTVDIAKYYPGDAYVDWVGVIGYYTRNDANPFPNMFGLTITKVRTFTQKPVLILETAAEPGERRIADINSLFAGVAADPAIVGFVWFDMPKRSDWRLSANPSALKEFKRLAADDRFGFDVRKL
ncbi:glycoside hydrolase family 26 protein [Streptomyces sp. NPDC051567]|uniref:glycoside hydrolase family 26 protein n=1 Tax=Streptomyces sp. NPDC051567 TaxID=3365660 RepID=UPI0037B9EDA9